MASNSDIIDYASKSFEYLIDEIDELKDKIKEKERENETLEEENEHLKGIIYGLLKSGVRHRDLNRIDENVWDEIIRYGMAFAANSCTSLNNSISQEFAKGLPSVN